MTESGFITGELPPGKWDITCMKKPDLVFLKRVITGEESEYWTETDLTHYFLDDKKNVPCRSNTPSSLRTLRINGESDNIIAFTNNRDAAILWHILNGESVELDVPVTFKVTYMNTTWVEEYKYAIIDSSEMDFVYSRYISQIFYSLLMGDPYRRGQNNSRFDGSLPRKNTMWRFFCFLVNFSKYMREKTSSRVIFYPDINYSPHGRNPGRLFERNNFMGEEISYASMLIMNEFFAYFLLPTSRRTNIIKIFPHTNSEEPVRFSFLDLGNNAEYVRIKADVDYYNEPFDIYPFMEDAELFSSEERILTFIKIKVFLSLFNLIVDHFEEIDIEDESFENIIFNIGQKLKYKVEKQEDSPEELDSSEIIEHRRRKYFET